MAPRKPSQNAWDSTLHVARYGTSGSRVVLCRFCGDVLRGSLTRVTEHFTWVMGVGGHGCERVPESMFYAYGGAKTRWQEVNSKLRPPLRQNVIDEKLARAIQEESLTKEARDAKRRAREEVQEESYSTQAATPIADVSGVQEGGCSSTPGASSHMGESRSAPPFVSSSQIHAHVSKKYKQHVAPHLQTTLASRFAPKLKKDAEFAEKQFFYQCNLAFRIARSPAYHRFYNTLVSAPAAGATGLRPVNAEALRTTHLKSQVAHIKKELVQLKYVLRRLVCSVEWSNWNGSRKPKATAMCDHILSNSFWDDAEAIKQAVSPLYFILRLFDHEGATMSLVYHYMQRLGTCMTTCNALSRERKDDLVQLSNERFDWFHKPIHIVAYMLHPLYKKLSHWNDRKLIEAWTRYIETVYATDDCSLLSTSQLDKLVYVNANLRLLERLRLRDGNGEGVLQWKVKDIDASVIANLERGLARGEAIDITFIQQRSDEDLAYDFLREEQTRFKRVTRAQARALQLPTEPSTMDAGVGPSTRGRSALARGGRRSRGGRATSSLVMREMMPSDESASSSSSTHSGMDAPSDSDFVSE
ncbi:hypothetical protein L7F22_053785 [Adiantum nelumboides]|nr:hypothetical protein [Adiantum nelumboides]